MSADSSHPGPTVQGRQSRRDFLKVGAGGLAGASLAAPAAAQLPGLRSATPRELQNLVGDGRRGRILLKGGIVLSLDPRVGDFEKADVLIDGEKSAQVAPNIAAGDAEVVDCAGTIVMPASSPPTIINTRRCSGASFPTACLAAPGLRKVTDRSFKTSGRPAGLRSREPAATRAR